MKKKIKYLFLILTILIVSCGSIKQIPVQTIETIVYRDSLIYLKDTLRIEVPKEIIKEVVAQMDTSYLKTSFAESTAYVNITERKLHHTLAQKGELKIEYDTLVTFKYIDRLITKDVPVEVEVVKYKRDTFFCVLLGWAALCVGYVLLNIFLKR